MSPKRAVRPVAEGLESKDLLSGLTFTAPGDVHVMSGGGHHQPPPSHQFNLSGTISGTAKFQGSSYHFYSPGGSIDPLGTVKLEGNVPEAGGAHLFLSGPQGAINVYITGALGNGPKAQVYDITFTLEGGRGPYAHASGTGTGVLKITPDVLGPHAKPGTIQYGHFTLTLQS
jgi:hypothetical protein